MLNMSLCMLWLPCDATKANLCHSMSGSLAGFNDAKPQLVEHGVATRASKQNAARVTLLAVQHLVAIGADSHASVH